MAAEQPMRTGSKPAPGAAGAAGAHGIAGSGPVTVSGGRQPPPRAATVSAALLCCGVLAACSLFLPKFQTPQLSVVGITVGRSDLFQQHLVVRMHVENPNDRELPVQGLSYVLMVSGEQVAQGNSEAAFVVPARGGADFDMGVTANLASALVRIFGRGAPAALDYRITGKVQLAAGLVRSVPFEQHGTFPLH